MKKKSGAKNLDWISKPFMLGGFASIEIIVLTFINMFFSGVFSGIFYVTFPLILVGYFFIFNAMYSLSKKYKNKMFGALVIVGIILMVLFDVGIFGVPYIASDYIASINQTSADYNQTIANLIANNSTDEQISQAKDDFSANLFNVFMPVFFVIITIIIVFLIYYILLGVAFIKFGKKVEYAKTIGILNIVGVCTLIIFVGVFALLAAEILSIVLLFNEAKRAKEI